MNKVMTPSKNAIPRRAVPPGADLPPPQLCHWRKQIFELFTFIPKSSNPILWHQAGTQNYWLNFNASKHKTVVTDLLRRMASSYGIH